MNGLVLVGFVAIPGFESEFAIELDDAGQQFESSIEDVF